MILLRFLVIVCVFILMSAHQSTTFASSQTLKVYKNSGARQCRAVDVPLEVVAKNLADNGIKVISSSCASDGFARTAVCESDSGLLYVYEIDRQHIQKAGELGFAEITKLDGYRQRPCPQPGMLP